MVRRVICIAAVILTVNPIFAEEVAFDPFPLNRGTIYEYGDEHVPDICFFPVSKARWDGYKITIGDWKKLTDYQKFSFASEASNEIENKGYVFKREIDLPLLVIMMNESIKVLEDAKENLGVFLMTYFIVMLNKVGAIAKGSANDIAAVTGAFISDSVCGDKTAKVTTS
jgi:hypothetical protein